MQKSLRTLLDRSCEKFKNNRFVYFIGGDGYTYGEFGAKVCEIAGLLSEYGIRRGDFVGLISQNMPNWSVAYFSAAAFGRVIVPMLPDFSESEVKHILKHSECRALFVSSKLLPKILDKATDRLSLIICLDDFSVIKGERYPDPEPPAEEKDIHPEDLASVIYTSGTTGSSKGVMLSHKNLCANVENGHLMWTTYEWDVFLSILPLSHTLESGLILMLPLLTGSSIYYLDKAPTPTILGRALEKVKPTCMMSVPLIIEKLYRTAVLPQLTRTRMTSFLYKIPPFRKKMNRIAGKKLVEKFGGKIRFFGIGGAKLDTTVEKFLIESRFPYSIGYGLTETSPLLAGATPGKVRLASTGPIVHGAKVMLLNKDPRTGVGEICAKGDNVMMGYYKNPEATAATFTEDGWFKTRDLGMFDKDGYLYIKGRSSTTIIGPSGENIYPEDIESVLNSHSMVQESIVTSRKGKLTALVHFDHEKLKAFLDSKDEFKKSAQEKVESLKKEILDYVNERVSKFSRIGDIDEQKEEFEKTATKKIKRYLYSGDESGKKEKKEKK